MCSKDFIRPADEDYFYLQVLFYTVNIMHACTSVS